jgi:ribosomal subunit interface protein
MSIPLQVTFRDVDSSPAVHQRIEERVERLERLDERILSCRVVVRMSERRHRKGRLFNIRIAAKVPGREIVITRGPAEHHAHQDIYVTVHDAFDALERRIEDAVRRRRGDVKTHADAEA